MAEVPVTSPTALANESPAAAACAPPLQPLARRPEIIHEHEGREVRDFGECREALRQGAGARTLGQHGLDGRAGSLGDAVEHVASVRPGQRFRNRIWSQTDDADDAWAELARQNV